jgi:hypothetical protein
MAGWSTRSPAPARHRGDRGLGQRSGASDDVSRCMGSCRHAAAAGRGQGLGPWWRAGKVPPGPPSGAPGARRPRAGASADRWCGTSAAGRGQVSSGHLAECVAVSDAASGGLPPG